MNIHINQDDFVYKKKQLIYPKKYLKEVNHKDTTDWANFLFYIYIKKINISKIRNKQVLNLGAGTGFPDSNLLLRLKNRVVALDLSYESLRILKNNLHNNFYLLDIVCADAENLPFKSNSFDLVFEMNTLHHLPNPIKCIKNSIEVSKEIIAIDSLKPVTTRFATKLGLFKEYGEIPSRLEEKNLRKIIGGYAIEIRYIFAPPHFYLTFNPKTKKIIMYITNLINNALNFNTISKVIGYFLGNYAAIKINRA